ncbi:MAG: hypothetical protein HY039_00665 [Nitrospirae bacterium]|nr:hypothetical protein [Nitrospirota bacterium]
MSQARQIGVAAVLVLALAVPVQAQMEQGMGSGMSPGMRGGMMGGTGSGGSMGTGGTGTGMMGSGKAGGHVMGYASPLDLKEELKLTADQAAQLKPMHAEYRKATIRKSAEVKAANIDLEELLSAKPIDYAKVEKQVKAIEALKSGLMLSRVDALKKVQGVLTQFEKYREKARRSTAHGTGMGMMGCMGKEMMCPMMKMMMEGGMMGQGMMGGGMMGGGMAPAKPQPKAKEPPAQAPKGEAEHESHHPGQ